jgi:hypothetical protein
MLYYLAIIREYFECDKYKKLYEEEKQKYEDLKTWTEKLISSNTELLDQVKEMNNTKLAKVNKDKNK